jgi:protein SCO1
MLKRLLPSFILLILLLGTLFFAQKYLNKPELPKLFTVPEFEFLSQQGTVFSNRDFSSKISVVDFIFTNCPGICPVMTNKMAALYEEYADEQTVQFVSFSVDPERDSLQALINYAQKWHVNDSRWYFLRTEKPEIQTLYEAGFKLGGELPYGHSGVFVLVDQNGIIRGYYSFDNEDELELLRRDITLLTDEM